MQNHSSQTAVLYSDESFINFKNKRFPISILFNSDNEYASLGGKAFGKDSGSDINL